MTAHEVIYDPAYGTIVNEADVPSNVAVEAVGRAVESDPLMAAAIASLQRWGQNAQAVGRSGGIFQRDRYVTPEKIFDQFKVALDAAESDDVVSGVLESTEALAFNKMSVESVNEEEEDIWNQIMDDIDLEARIREMWRELFTVSQFYAVVWWGRKDYKVRGKSDKGVARKKSFNKMRVPRAISLLDPLKVVPVGSFLFGQEKLAYIANRSEAENFDEVLAGANTTDLAVRNLIKARYVPDEAEKKYLKEITDANVDNLYLLNPDNVWRHTLTRPAYQRFATVRMKSVFELLDMKQQLRQMDRAHLVGGTNFIILVKKGSDTLPAKPAEVSQLAAQVRSASRVPVLVGDHRIEVEIVTPKMDNTLKPERYNAIDARISARLYQIFMTGNYAAGAKGDDSIKLARVVARGLESRRHMLRRAIEDHIFFPTYEKNKDKLTEKPQLVFHPKRISLEFDSNVLTYLQDLRDRGDISRETLLQEIDLNQADEARKREKEDKRFDKVFKPVHVPYSGNAQQPVDGDDNGNGSGQQAPGNTRGIGRRGGGNNNGGGMNRNSLKSNPGRGPAKSELEDFDFEDDE